MHYPRKFVTILFISLFLVLGAGQALAAQYTVQSGDTLYKISLRFNTSVNTLVQNNGLSSTSIYPGQVLTVPSASGKYVVKSGDTLYNISRLFTTSVDNLMKTNGLKTSSIYPGQVLNVPLYTVKAGDTLYLLSKRFGVSVTLIKSQNGLKSDTLYPGQQLLINGSSAASTTASSASTTASRGAGSYSRSEVLLLARLINAESRGEPYTGQVAVGAVVLNRVKSSKFPNTLSGVIYQQNEFSVVNDGQINLSPSTTSIQAAEDAMNGWDPSNGALFYWNPAKAPNNAFLNSKTIVARIGNHVFAK